MSQRLLDADSPTWLLVNSWAEQELARAREALETPGLDPLATERLRGSITALRSLMALNKPTAVMSAGVDYLYAPEKRVG